jgi:ubiquinone/menaquinone biosynthesis C-methylase UbiE
MMDVNAVRVEKGITPLAFYTTVDHPDKREVKRNYDELGGGLYDLRYGEEQYRKYDAAFLVTLPRGDALLLDDGCGTGMLLARLDSPAVGLDLTPSLLLAARKKLRMDHHLILGDAEHLPIKDCVFDGVYAITLIQNTPDKRKAVSEMRRVVKTHGKILVTALKVVFTQDFLTNLLEQLHLQNVATIGDAGTNDWIVSAEKE